jgi:hypothetical protein
MQKEQNKNNIDTKQQNHWQIPFQNIVKYTT